MAQLGASAESGAIVRAIIELALALKIDVTAEGVETEAQAAALRALHCDEVQGFLYGRPLPAPDVAALLVAEPVTARG